MDPDGWLARLGADAGLLAAAVPVGGWDAPVPGTRWSVRQLLVHTGAVHRWSADIVRRGLARNETGGSRAFHPSLPDSELLPWFADGLDQLVLTLAAAPPRLAAWTFTPTDDARAFWCRRQAHETAIHRADAQAAAHLEITAFDAAFAQDGLDELLGFAAEPPFATDRPGRLAFVATDGPSRLLTFGGPVLGAAVGDDPQEFPPADASVTGTSSELYRWAWNRPSPAVEGGDPAVVDLWREVRIT